MSWLRMVVSGSRSGMGFGEIKLPISKMNQLANN
jgi:hypothetical protein